MCPYLSCNLFQTQLVVSYLHCRTFLLPSSSLHCLWCPPQPHHRPSFIFWVDLVSPSSKLWCSLPLLLFTDFGVSGLWTLLLSLDFYCHWTWLLLDLAVVGPGCCWTWLLLDLAIVGPGCCWIWLLLDLAVVGFGSGCCWIWVLLDLGVVGPGHHWTFAIVCLSFDL